MLIFLGVVIVFGLVGWAVSGSGWIGLIVGVFFFAIGYRLALVQSIIYNAIDYAEDRADARQERYALSEAEREWAERQEGIFATFNDNRQVHYHKHGDDAHGARKHIEAEEF